MARPRMTVRLGDGGLAALQFSKKCKRFRRFSDCGTTPRAYSPHKARLAVVKAIVIIADDLQSTCQ